MSEESVQLFSNLKATIRLLALTQNTYTLRRPYRPQSFLTDNFAGTPRLSARDPPLPSIRTGQHEISIPHVYKSFIPHRYVRLHRFSTLTVSRDSLQELRNLRARKRNVMNIRPVLVSTSLA